MGKYYYVDIANRVHYYKNSVISENVKRIADSYAGSWWYDDPSRSSLLNIKGNRSVPIFCTEGNSKDTLIEVVSGREYKKSTNYIFSERLAFIISREVTATEVAKQLKLLNRFNVKKYIRALDELEKTVASDYIEDQKKLVAESKKEQESDLYIKSFRKKWL